ncbi:MAG: aminodeoxychorismate/anthranilate synthase component II [Oscillospiraceae bacterium]|nr:aminodeoxychorismate/anthranilate synthase component II [Oscillospiraceae bacterium]
MVLLIDNYDSFSYNLYQAIGVIDENIKVVRNDELSVEEIVGMSPTRVVISPGPGRPAGAGRCIEIVRALHKKIPLLGICLGHQVIFETFGGTVSYAAQLMHGKCSEITIDKDNPLFEGVSPVIRAARYHSLAGIKETLPPELKIIATAKDGEIMGLCHKEYPVYGLQFHPESILTPEGGKIVENFLRKT